MTEPRDLSPRQREALLLAAHGLTYQEIADAMGIERSTVKWTLREAYDKLAARDLMDACRVLGWHNPPSIERSDVA